VTAPRLPTSPCERPRAEQACSQRGVDDSGGCAVVAWGFAGVSVALCRHINENTHRTIDLPAGLGPPPRQFRAQLRDFGPQALDLGEDGRKAIVEERARGPYTSFDDFLHRLRGAPVGPSAVRNLVMVGGFDALGQPRRELLWGWQERWHGHGLRQGIAKQSELRLKGTAPALPEIDEFDANQLEYRISDLSTGHHLIHFCRERLQKLGALESNKLAPIRNNQKVRVAGLVITRQAPSTAKKIRFFTLEDEFGQVNVTIKPDVYDRYRQVANLKPILVIDGVMQRQDGVWSVLASHIQALEGVPRPHQRSHDYR